MAVIHGTNSVKTAKKSKSRYFVLDMGKSERLSKYYGYPTSYSSKLNAEKGLCKYIMQNICRIHLSGPATLNLIFNLGKLLPENELPDKLNASSFRSFICSFIKKDHDLYLKIMDLILEHFSTKYYYRARAKCNYNQFIIIEETINK